MRHRFRLHGHFRVCGDFLRRFGLFLGRSRSSGANLFCGGFTLRLPGTAFFFPSALFFQRLVPVIHGFNSCGQIEVLPVLHHNFRRVFRGFDCSHVGHNAVHKRLCLFFQGSYAVAHVDLRPVGQIVHPVNASGLHQLVIIFLNGIRLLGHDTGSNVRNLPFQLCICGLERHRHALAVDFLKLSIRFKDFVLDSNALGLVLLKFLGQLRTGILDTLIGLLGADQREGFSRALLNVSLYAMQPLHNDGQLLQFDDLQCGFICHVASSFYLLKIS